MVKLFNLIISIVLIQGIRLMKSFYTAKEAQERLGMNNNNFHYLVRKGTIKKVTLPGKKQSVYPRTEVDKLASTLKTLIQQYDREKSIFRLATLADMQEEFEMDISLYGKKTASLEDRIEKLQKNPESDYVLINEEQLVGHVSFFPVEQEMLHRFLVGEIGEIPASKVLLFESERPVDILMLVMGVIPGFPPDVTSHYGLRLIAGVIKVLRELGERGIILNTIYATSRTLTGIRLCRKLDMSEESIPNQLGRFKFSLDAQTSKSLLVRRYQQGLEKYKNQVAPQ